MFNSSHRFVKTASAFLIGVTANMAAISAAGASWRADDAKYIASPVRYDDLDLTSSGDVDRLVRRLEMKAARMCREINSVIATRKMINRCRKEIVDANRPKITAAVEAAHKGRVEP